MDTFEINVGATYSGTRRRGDRRVADVKRHRGQEAVVHYVDQRTQKTGNAPLKKFAADAVGLARIQA